MASTTKNSLAEAKNPSSQGSHALVIGGSMAGLLTARVLANHFDRVTIVERDHLADVPEARKGTPMPCWAAAWRSWSSISPASWQR